MEGVQENIRAMVITPSLECGGAERFVSLLCNKLDISELHLTLVVINNDRPFYKITNPVVKVLDLKAGRVSTSFFKLRKAIKNEQPDIVFTTANHLNLFVAISRIFFPSDIIWMARETSVVSINSKYARWPVAYDLLLKKLYRRLDHIICQSTYMQDDLVRHYNVDINKTSIIYNGVDPLLKFYDGQVKKYSFITVARLSREKGIDRLLRSLATLHIPFRYYIVGDGPEKENLYQLSISLGIQEQVIFCGELSYPFSGMEGSHLYLMGSLYEGLPNSVIEALAIGIPVVAINAPGGIEEIVMDGDNGFLAESEEDLGEKILAATEYPFNRQHISAASQERFSIEKMKRSVLQVFSELYSRKK